jgi:hypothetical protein
MPYTISSLTIIMMAEEGKEGGGIFLQMLGHRKLPFIGPKLDLSKINNFDPLIQHCHPKQKQAIGSC